LLKYKIKKNANWKKKQKKNHETKFSNQLIVEYMKLKKIPIEKRQKNSNQHAKLVIRVIRSS
jgi:hypothetical protein